MQAQFKQILNTFYAILLYKKEQSDMYKQALERYLCCAQLQDEKFREREKDIQQIKSLKSFTSSNSTSSFIRIKKLFKPTLLETAIFFSFFLLIIKTNKPQFLAFLMKKVSERVLTVRKRITLQQKKKFQSKFNKLYNQLNYLSQRMKNNNKIEWFYLEVFSQFESECSLLAQLISSTGQDLQTLQNIRASDFLTLFSMLKIKCHIWEKKKREYRIIGFGENRVYIGRKGDQSYFIMTEKQYELELKLARKGPSEPRRQTSAEESSLKQLKKYPTQKLKQQFLTEITKLKQDYEQNTSRIASLFNFKDSIEGWRQIDQTRHA